LLHFKGTCVEFWYNSCPHDLPVAVVP
jgi:hypothetical protein